MRIWLVIDGERKGPFPDYEIRDMIRRAVVSGETMCWHEGMDGWKRLDSLSIFGSEFESPDRERPESRSVLAMPPMLPGHERAPSFWMRRFWARWLDLSLYSGLWWLLLYMLHADIGSVIQSVWILLLLYLPWVPLEALMISQFSSTPGKWLLGLRVRNDDGTRLAGRQSVVRALRVYFLGIGMGWSLVALVCQLLSFFHVRSNGKALWDLHAGHRVDGGPLGLWRIPAYVIAMVVATQMQWIVVAPYVLEDMQKKMPAMKEWMHDNPPYHLPRR